MNTAKLSEKQTNIICAALASLLVVGFAVLIYFDYEELVETESKLETKKTEIKQAEQKRDQIPELKAQLWYMQKKHHHFKEMLPTRQESASFYAKLDRYRIEKGIKPWKSLRTKETIVEENEGLDPMSMKSKATPAKPPVKPPAKPAPGQKPTVPGEFIETTHSASFSLTFDQLLQFLGTLEADERFYAVREIKIGVQEVGTAKVKGKEARETRLGNPELNTDLTIVSFAYTGDMPTDQEVAKLIDEKYEPPTETQEKLVNDTKLWLTKDESGGRSLRNPFDKEQVLQRIQKDSTDETHGEKIVPPPATEQLKVELERLQKLRNELHILAVAESWVDLQNMLGKNDYERSLLNVQTTSANDPQGVYAEKISQLRKELTEWKKNILEAGQEQKARQLVAHGQKKIEEIEKLYKDGKEKGIQEPFEQIISIHNEVMPQFREVMGLESKIKELEKTRKELERLYSMADTQIKIIQMASKLKLQGIIYIPNTKDGVDAKDLSIVFINKQMMRKNDIVMGFVIQEIQENGIVLRYKEETVPVKFLRLDDKIKAKKLQN